MEFKKLFEPINIGKISLKNRIVMAPMNLLNLCDYEGGLTQRCVDYYVERAKGGVGLIITGVFKVENEVERYFKRGVPAWPIFTPKALPAFAELADSVHSYGAKVFIQLSAGAGRVADGEAIDAGFEPVSASMTPCFFRPSVTTRPLTTEEIEKIVKAFGSAAKLVATAEIDGIEVHGHEGYLIDQFTTALWNKRTDKYGGPLKSRMRFPLEIIETIKDSVGTDFPVIYRYGAKHFLKNSAVSSLKREGYAEAGRDMPEALEMARILETAGVDALHIDSGCYESMYWAHPPMYQPHGCTIDLSAEIKNIAAIPVIAVNRLDMPEMAERVLEEEKADMIAIGRGLLADAYWPEKVFQGHIDDIRPCIGCQEGCLNISNSGGRPLSCSVNPQCGRERLSTFDQPSKMKNILIIGGGVAGMEAARVSAIRGHKVTLYEETDRLGGHLIEGSVPDFKRDIGRLLEWYENQLPKVKVKVRLKTKVTPELLEKEKPDVVIIATGSTPIIPKIPGIENPNVCTCSDLLLGKKTAGDQVIVVGGGLEGCETALWLAQQGKNVTIVEMLPQVATGMHDANRNMLLEMLAENKARILTNTRLQEVTNDGVITKESDSKSNLIKCDTVALAVGLKSEKEIFEWLNNKDSVHVKEIYSVGDCNKPRKIHHAIWDGSTVAASV